MYIQNVYTYTQSESHCIYPIKAGVEEHSYFSTFLNNIHHAEPEIPRIKKKQCKQYVLISL